MGHPFVSKLVAETKVTEHRLFNEWIALAPMRGIEPVVIIFAKHAREWLEPDETGNASLSLTLFNQLSDALKALSNDPTNTSPQNELGHRPAKKLVEPAVRSILSPDDADEFLGAYNMYYWSTGIVRACTWGEMSYVSDDLKEALFNYLEVKSIVEGSAPMDLYTESDIEAASRSYIFAESFLSDLVPEFVRFLGEVPNDEQVKALVGDKFGRERMLALARYGAAVMYRFVKTLELLPAAVVTQQIQAFRDLTSTPVQQHRLQAYIADIESSDRTESFNVGMNLLGVVVDGLPKSSQFNQHLTRVAYEAERNPFDDLGNLNLG